MNEISTEDSKLTTDEVKLIWDHAINHANTLNERFNFFLVIESILLGFAGVLFTRPTSTLILKGLSGLGLLLTLLLWYVQARQRYLLFTVTKYLAKKSPVYQEIVGLENSHPGRYPVGSTWLLANIMPIMFSVVWLVLSIIN